MVDIGKALMAIEEKEKWEEREKKILEELKQLKERKKELKEESKKLKDKINECENALRSMDIANRDSSEVYLGISEELKRM